MSKQTPDGGIYDLGSGTGLSGYGDYSVPGQLNSVTEIGNVISGGSSNGEVTSNPANPLTPIVTTNGGTPTVLTPTGLTPTDVSQQQTVSDLIRSILNQPTNTDRAETPVLQMLNQTPNGNNNTLLIGGALAIGAISFFVYKKYYGG